jgi:hypothetical protein
LWGSSAGARMAAAIGSHGVERFGGDALPKPSTVVMAYTAHSDHSVDEPPTFVAVGERDGIAAPSVMERRVAALRKAGTEVEFHRYRDIGHGFGPGVGTSAEGWLDRATQFWERHSRPATDQQDACIHNADRPARIRTSPSTRSCESAESRSRTFDRSSRWTSRLETSAR